MFLELRSSFSGLGVRAGQSSVSPEESIFVCINTIDGFMGSKAIFHIITMRPKETEFPEA